MQQIIPEPKSLRADTQAPVSPATSRNFPLLLTYPANTSPSATCAPGLDCTEEAEFFCSCASSKGHCQHEHQNKASHQKKNKA